jgi:hypothetical protein
MVGREHGHFFQQGELDVPITDLSVCVYVLVLVAGDTSKQSWVLESCCFRKIRDKVQGWLNERKVLCVRVYHVISLV